MITMVDIRLLTAYICAILLLVSCQFAPPANYAYTPEIVSERCVLAERLLLLLPPEQRDAPAAVQEATWLADTSYRAGVAIARYNEPFFMAWMNNRMVNSIFTWRERGLCWHYQHDMYRELRRRRLEYFRIGCCVRDRNKGSEHHCVYLAPVTVRWPQCIIIDPWLWNGRLEVLYNGSFSTDKWQEEEGVLPYLQSIYPEEHNKPFEHWARVKAGWYYRDYAESSSPRGRASRQGRLMQRRIEQGMRLRGGKLYSY